MRQIGLLLMALVIVLNGRALGSGDHETIRILFLGDTSFGENYHDRLASQGREPVLRTRGYDHMIELFGGLLADADFTVANLETPVTDRFPSPFAGEKDYLHYADVEKTPDQLQKRGFDLLSLANNHALDFGMPGLEQTLDVLNARGLRVCGAGADAETAERPFVKVFEAGEHPLTLAVLCNFEYRKEYDEDYAYYAGEGRGGVAALSSTAIAVEVDRLRQTHPGIFVIAYPHWGDNYEWATEEQREQAAAMLDAGVDTIIGHGAHLVQEIERRDGRWIVYGLGNFVFGSPGRYGERDAHPYSAVAMLTLSPDSLDVVRKIRLYPIFTDNRLTGYRPRFVTGQEFEEVRFLLRERSGAPAEFDQSVRVGEDEHGRFLEWNL